MSFHSKARRLVLRILTQLARRRVRSDAVIIGITGSVGKTTAKEAILKLLQSRYRTHANQGSFNSEFGVPLTLLELPSGYASPLAWAGILMRAVWQARSPLAAERIVLELGVDTPGDMDTLLTIVQPTIGVFTGVAPVHLAPGQFASVEEIASEKAKLIAALPESGTAVLNADDALVVASPTAAHRLSYSLTGAASLSVSNLTQDTSGITATIEHGKAESELRLACTGKHNLYPILAAIGVGLASGFSLAECTAALRDFQLPAGRGQLLAGIRGSTLLDSSYNSNPTSLTAALHTLAELPCTGRRIALLGQMNELGEASSTEHKRLGVLAAAAADEVVGVHGEAWHFAAEAKLAGKIGKFFGHAEDAAAYLTSRLQSGDLILVKGSQNAVRLEKAAAKLLENPNDTAKLCRQGEYWQTH